MRRLKVPLLIFLFLQSQLMITLSLQQLDGHQPATTFHPLNFEAFVLLINQLPFKDPG